MTNNNDKICDYLTFPKTFENYKWYKPILVIIVCFIMMFILEGLFLLGTYLVGGSSSVILFFGGLKGGLNSAMSVLSADLIIFMFIPSLYLATKIVKDRPFSSYSSSRGGWNFKLYFKALIIPLVLYLIYQSIDTAVNGAKGTPQFSILFLIVIFVTVPLPIYSRRIHISWTFLANIRSWLKIPIIAIVIQAIIFALFHGYNSFGFMETLIMGLICGFFAWKTNGLEVSCAMHTANNFAVGLFVMLGLQTSTSSPQLTSVLATVIFEIVLCLIIYYGGKKTDWFGEISENSQNI